MLNKYLHRPIMSPINLKSTIKKNELKIENDYNKQFQKHNKNYIDLINNIKLTIPFIENNKENEEEEKDIVIITNRDYIKI